MAFNNFNARQTSQFLPAAFLLPASNPATHWAGKRFFLPEKAVL
jgi:hypothetical protein